MHLKDYQEQVKRTCPDLGSQQLNIAHMIFGLNSEFNELYDAIVKNDQVNISEELSDIAWYFCNYCNFTEISITNVTSFLSGSYYNYVGQKENIHLIKLQSEISKLTDIEKRELAYKKPVQQANRLTCVIGILQALNDCFTYYKIDPYISMQKNIDKLKARYPEKFTEEKALNRNIEIERKILEK